MPTNPYNGVDNLLAPGNHVLLLIDHQYQTTAASLTLIPRTSSLGVLVTSGFLGGAICIHIANHEDFVFPSVLLALIWVSAWLRDLCTLASFSGNSVAVTTADEEDRPSHGRSAEDKEVIEDRGK